MTISLFDANRKDLCRDMEIVSKSVVNVFTIFKRPEYPVVPFNMLKILTTNVGNKKYTF